MIYPPASATGRTPPRATRSYVPRSKRLRSRRFAPHTRFDRHPCLAPPSHSFSPLGWSGEYIAASAALSVRRSRHRPPLRHTGLTVLPPAQRLRRARLRRISVPPDFIESFAGCTFPSPPFRFCSLFSACNETRCTYRCNETQISRKFSMILNIQLSRSRLMGICLDYFCRNRSDCNHCILMILQHFFVQSFRIGTIGYLGQSRCMVISFGFAPVLNDIL